MKSLKLFSTGRAVSETDGRFSIKSPNKQLLTIAILFILLIGGQKIFAQKADTSILRLSYSLIDYPQNFGDVPIYPSMVQSTELSNDLYDVSFWGIDALGKVIFKNKNNTKGGKIARGSFNYLAGFAFAYYGSELPVTLGVYNHEQYHNSVLAANGYSSLNGNWIFNRWDGTVYGLTDEQLTEFKADNLSGLLYSYVSGVQSENVATQTNVIQDFYHRRTFYKNPFYLYNALYVWKYFNFSTSAESDSVKVIAPEYEDSDPYYRDFAGADLTAWVYDMFNPDEPYASRDPFPDGEGVNRRIGFSDLNPEEQDYLVKQKNLSWLNFVNPAIFLVNRIKINPDFSFLVFLQYSPTNFGNDIAVFIPFKTKSFNQLFAFHTYSNYQNTFFGIQYGLVDVKPFSNKKIALGASVNLWNQPENQSFYDTSGKFGGSFELQADYEIGKGFSANLAGGYKSAGWTIGNPYLESKGNLRVGIKYSLKK